VRFVFRREDRAIFEHVKTGVKSVETRAATKKYSSLLPGDVCLMVCGRERVEKTIHRVRTFRTIDALFRAYPIKKVMPWVRTIREAKRVYDGFPGYREKIAEFGIIALEFAGSNGKK
jgi:ASC-1-like (ASCH) protein